MLSQKLQDDLMSAYQKVYEEKRGHAAGADDTEKQASQLASDVRYKAKGKVPEGASKEEKMKIFLQILGASPAPNVVKAMAKQKLLGEEVVKEMRFDDGKEGTEKRKEALRKKRGMTKKEMDKHPQFKTEGASYGITRGSGKPSGVMADFIKKKKKKEKEEVKEMVKKIDTDAKPIIKPDGNILKKGSQRDGVFKPKKGAKMGNIPLDTAHYELNGDPLQEEEKAPRMQKGAMAYDGPNKERSEAADRILAKTKKKRKKMNEMSCPSPKVVDTSSKSKDKKITPSVLDKIRKLNTGAGSQYEQVVHEKMDAVGKEDKDIDNDGDHDSTDKYLLKRRKAIGKAIAKKRGRVKEGFSAWRIDLDFQEQVKK